MIRLKMLYKDFLRLNPCARCNFCAPKNTRIFAENESAYLTYALAPYHKHHLLVIPKKHKLSFLDLDAEETMAVWELMKEGENILKKLGYGTFSVLVREGTSTDKSVEHLHYHIIPNERIGDLDHDGN